MEKIHPAQVGQELARGNKPVIRENQWYILQGSRIITSDMMPQRQEEQQQLLKDVKHVFDGAEQRREIGKAQAQDRLQVEGVIFDGTI